MKYKVVIFIVLSLFFVHMLSSYANNYLISNDIFYDNSSSMSGVDDVQSAIDDLYQKQKYNNEHIDYSVVNSIVFDISYYAYNNWNGERTNNGVFYLDIKGPNEAIFRTSPAWSTSNAYFNVSIDSINCTSAGVGTYVFNVVTNETTGWSGAASVTSKLTVTVDEDVSITTSAKVFSNNHSSGTNGAAIITFNTIAPKIKTIHDASKVNFSKVKSILLSINFTAYNSWNGTRSTNGVYYIDILGENEASFRTKPSWSTTNASFDVSLKSVNCNKNGIGTYTLSVTNTESNGWSGAASATKDFVITITSDGEITNNGVVTNGNASSANGYAGTTFKDISIITK